MEEEETPRCCRNAHWEDVGMHGVRRLVRGPTWRSVIWTILIVIAGVLVAYSLANNVMHYMSYPVVTDTSRKHTRDVKYDVTMCNKNPWRLTQLQKKGWWSAGEGTNITSTEAYSTAGHPIGDMLLKCNVGGFVCSTSNFTMVYTEHGFCYRLSITARVGEQLHLILNTEEYEYVEKSTQQVGVTMYFSGSEPGTLGPAEYVTVGPGVHTDVTLQLYTTRQLEAPYGMCGGMNDQGSCHKECITKLYTDRCDCTQYWSTETAPTFDKPPCSIKMEECARKQESESRESCDCPMPCEYSEYQVRMSSSPLSARDYHVYLSNNQLTKITDQLLQANNIRSTAYGNDANNYQLGPEFVRNNIISVSVKIARDGELVTEHRPAYTLEKLLRDIGFMFVIFLGVSVLSLVEIIEILASCICCRSSRDKNTLNNVYVK